MNINVLSLFDGMSAGFQALKQAGIPVKNYYASEIDKYAIQVAMKNHPEIIQLGDVTKWREWDLPKIDLLIGGSPCQGFSNAGNGLNFDHPQSRLFFEYVKIKEALGPKHFFLENVNMKKEWQDIISGALGVEPKKINSKQLSAQNRKRTYWANWDFLQPTGPGELLKDILQDSPDCPIGIRVREKSKCARVGGRNSPFGCKQEWDSPFQRVSKKGEVRAGIEKANCLTGGANSGGNHSDMDILHSEFFTRRYTATECERLQTFPDNYTKIGAYIPDLKRTGKCAKQTTIAIIENKGKFYTGTNDCKTPQSECPRKDMPTGVGYDLCKSVCNQTNHAEVNACLKAGKNARGGTLYLIGHSYCCDNCKEVMEEHGVEKVVIGAYPGVNISNTQRYKMLGNGWTVAVIEHIFKALKLQHT